MILGLLFAAMIAGVAVSAVMFVLGQPVWIVVLAYPVTGTAVLLLELFVVGMAGRSRIGATGVVPTGLVHCPVPRSTAPTVANKTLMSVAKETSRS